MKSFDYGYGRNCVQFNGQLKGRMSVANDAQQSEVEEQLKAMSEF